MTNRAIGKAQIKLYREKTPVPPELHGQGPFCRRCHIHGKLERCVPSPPVCVAVEI